MNRAVHAVFIAALLLVFTGCQSRVKQANSPKPGAVPVEEGVESKKRPSWFKRAFSSRREKVAEAELEKPEELASGNRPLTPPKKKEAKSKPKPRPKPVVEKKRAEPKMPEPELDSPSEPSLPGGWQAAPNSPRDVAETPSVRSLPDPEIPTDRPAAPAPQFSASTASGVPVAGKPEYIRSPYGNKGLIERKGIASGSLIKCPYTGKWLRVP